MSNALLQFELFLNKYSSSPAVRACAVGSWVAEICGIDTLGGFKKKFLRGFNDYTNANGVGSRGIMTNYILSENKIYEVQQQTGWKKSQHYFCRVEQGQIVEVKIHEVIKCLNGQSE